MPTTTWKPTLIGWLVTRFWSYLSGGLESDTLVWDLDDSGDRVCLRRPEGETLADIRLRLAWPHTLHSFVKTRWIAIDFNVTHSRAGSVQLDRLVTTFGKRIAELEQRIERPLALLFPRDAEGEIDWSRSPLADASLTPQAHSGADMLKLGDIPCGLRCAFCTRSLWPEYSAPPALFLMDQVYRAALSLGRVTAPESRILIGSGEPGRHPDIVSIVRLARRRGYRDVRLETSALDSLFPHLIHRLPGAGLTMIQLPLYADNADIHDEIVGQPGHFDLIGKAAQTLREAGVEVRIHSVPLTLNLAHIAKLPAFCADLGLTFEGFQYPRREGASRIPYEQLAPRLSELPVEVKARINMTVPCVGIKSVHKTPIQAGLDRELLGQRGQESNRAIETEYPPQCDRCRAKIRCTGIYRGYLELHGSDEFLPI